jgi:tRNA threonylcarbamoyl adenosine modification protein YeaZ
MSWMLAFDVSTVRTVVLVGRHDADGLGELRARRELDDQPNQASSRLVALIEACCADAGIAPPDLELIAVGRGPGTFTGSRVAVATAQGLAYGLGCPAVPVSTLAATAASHPASGTLFGLLDARRGEVYMAGFELDDGGFLRPTTAERCGPLGELLAADDMAPELAGAHFVGSGVSPYRAELPTEAEVRELAGPSAEGLWRAATAAARRGDACPPGQLEVVYLRETYAQMGIHKPKRPPHRSPFI